MANNFQTFDIAIGDDGEIGVLLDQIRGIDQLAIDLTGQRCTSQTGTNTGSDFSNGNSLFVTADGTIGEFDIWHDELSGKKAKKKCGASRTFLFRTKADSI
jgi:predicted 3-demethylubiquinone-9 3-methyltransferase (glyoxalase superfamily)